MLAFGVSDILSSWGEQIRLRKEIRHYVLHVAWTVLLILLMVQMWWSMWRLREITSWTYSDYLILIVPYLLLSLIAYVLTPSVAGGGRDIKRYYYDNSPWIFGLGAVFIATAIINTNNLLHTSYLDPTNTIRGSGLLLMVVLAIWKNERFQIAAIALAYALLVAWIGFTMFAI